MSSVVPCSLSGSSAVAAAMERAEKLLVGECVAGRVLSDNREQHDERNRNNQFPNHGFVTPL